jgi:hypothetical protein
MEIEMPPSDNHGDSLQRATLIEAGLAIVQRTRRAWFGEAQFSSAHGMAERPCSRPEPARLCSIEP